MKKWFNIFNIYVFLLVLYEYLTMKGASAMSTYLSLGPSIAIAVYYIAKALEMPKSSYMKALTLFICMMIVYGLIRFIGGETLYAGEASRPQSFILLFMHQMPAVLVFYMLAKEDKIRIIDLKLWLFVFLLMAYLHYQHNYELFLAKMSIIGSTMEEMTNNMGYLFLSILPFVVLFYKKPWIQYAIIAIVGFFVINSAKRGAILLFALSFAFFLYVNMKNKSLSSWGKLLVYVFSFVVVVVGFNYLQRHFLESDYFYLRYTETMEGNSSGRDWIYSDIWHHYINEYNFFQMIFGGGIESTLRYIRFYAHNDWLQLLSDCGLFGLSVYVFYWKSYCKTMIDYKRNGSNDNIYILIVTAFIIAFGKTLFSMSYTDMPVSLAIAIGYGMANAEKINFPIL